MDGEIIWLNEGRAKEWIPITGNVSEEEIHAILSEKRTDRRDKFVMQVFGLLFTAKVRRDIWTHVITEDMADFRQAMSRCRTRSACAWIRFCFAGRTVVRIGQTLQAVGVDRLLGWASGVVSGVVTFWRRAK